MPLTTDFACIDFARFWFVLCPSNLRSAQIILRCIESEINSGKGKWINLYSYRLVVLREVDWGFHHHHWGPEENQSQDNSKWESDWARVNVSFSRLCGATSQLQNKLSSIMYLSKSIPEGVSNWTSEGEEKQMQDVMTCDDFFPTQGHHCDTHQQWQQNVGSDYETQLNIWPRIHHHLHHNSGVLRWSTGSGKGQRPSWFIGGVMDSLVPCVK